MSLLERMFHLLDLINNGNQYHSMQLPIIFISEKIKYQMLPE
jgi:hypothetical protein